MAKSQPLKNVWLLIRNVTFLMSERFLFCAQMKEKISWHCYSCYANDVRIEQLKQLKAIKSN